MSAEFKTDKPSIDRALAHLLKKLDPVAQHDVYSISDATWHAAAQFDVGQRELEDALAASNWCGRSGRSRAFYEGREAARNSGTKAVCPHAVGSACAMDWQDGLTSWARTMDAIDTVQRPFIDASEKELRLELHLRRGPSFQCQSPTCRSYQDRPGKWDTCPSCGIKGYLTGSFVLNKDSSEYQAWERRTFEAYRQPVVLLRAGRGEGHATLASAAGTELLRSAAHALANFDAEIKGAQQFDPDLFEVSCNAAAQEAAHGCGLSDVLWAKRTTSAIDRLLDQVESAFLLQAKEIAKRAGWLDRDEVESMNDASRDEGLCSHGLDPDCCPAGCGEVD